MGVAVLVCTTIRMIPNLGPTRVEAATGYAFGVGRHTHSTGSGLGLMLVEMCVLALLLTGVSTGMELVVFRLANSNAFKPHSESNSWP